MSVVQDLHPKTDDLTEIQVTRKCMEHLIEVCFDFLVVYDLNY